MADKGSNSVAYAIYLMAQWGISIDKTVRKRIEKVKEESSNE